MKIVRTTFLALLLVICSNSFAYETSIYVWQRQWHKDILDSLNIIKSSCQRFTVLAGDFKQTDGRIGFSNVDVNWRYLQDKGDVTLVFRLHTNLSSIFKTNNLFNIAVYFKEAAQTTISEAKKCGVNIRGIQLDYDCPTSKLKDFNRFLQTIRNELPLIQLSITALPTWINSNAFPQLITSVDYYVLQLHSFEIPKGNDKKQYIFPFEKAPEYFNSALALKRPFYVSLPTYGYEVAYGKDGQFLGLRAEGGVEFMGKDINRRLMFADSRAIVNFVRKISNNKTEYFKGICWFRLPITSDRLNWNIKTFERVIKGELPKTLLEIEILNREPDIREVYILNTGEVNITSDVSFDLNWTEDKKPIYDVLGSYTYSNIPKGIRIKGRAPLVGNKTLVAWFRDSNLKDHKILNSEVTIDESN